MYKIFVIVILLQTCQNNKSNYQSKDSGIYSMLLGRDKDKKNKEEKEKKDFPKNKEIAKVQIIAYLKELIALNNKFFKFRITKKCETIVNKIKKRIDFLVKEKINLQENEKKEFVDKLRQIIVAFYTSYEDKESSESDFLSNKNSKIVSDNVQIIVEYINDKLELNENTNIKPIS